MRSFGFWVALAVVCACGCQLKPPKRPKGPEVGRVGQQLTFQTRGSDPLKVHHYKWDWGDGSEIKWRHHPEVSHAWRKPGTYKIRVKERCPWFVFYTQWSKPATVRIVAK
jgi:hypothetical protein